MAGLGGFLSDKDRMGNDGDGIDHQLEFATAERTTG